MSNRICLIKRDVHAYPKALFRPSERYPEYLFADDISEERNDVYDMIREGFLISGYDKANYGTSQWNPLGDYVSPGDTVLLKPNMVMDHNPSGEGIECLFTQPSIVAAVLDYVIIALKGSGKIVIGDAPMQECNFDKLLNESGFDRLYKYYQERIKNIEIELVDFRGLHSYSKKGVHHYIYKETDETIVNLGGDSEFSLLTDDENKLLRIPNYDNAIMSNHHIKSTHEYSINSNVLYADVVINLPKPKTHKKAGVTIAMKNFIGVCSRKEYLPHHTIPYQNVVGDAYSKRSIINTILIKLQDKKCHYAQEENYSKAQLFSYLIFVAKKIRKLVERNDLAEGCWYGNDTISRTIVDINKIVFYSDKEGIMHNEKQRKYLIIADMIVSGEKNGPVAPSAKDVGIIAIGDNPVVFDEGIATIMGVKTQYINTLKHAKNPVGCYNLDDGEDSIVFISNDSRWKDKNITQLDEAAIINYSAPDGWLEAFVSGDINQI